MSAAVILQYKNPKRKRHTKHKVVLIQFWGDRVGDRHNIPLNCRSSLIFLQSRVLNAFNVRSPVSMKPKIRLARSASKCGWSGGIPRIQKDFPRFFRRELQSPFREDGVPCSPNIQNRSFASQSFFFRINEREAII